MIESFTAEFVRAWVGARAYSRGLGQARIGFAPSGIFAGASNAQRVSADVNRSY